MSASAFTVRLAQWERDEDAIDAIRRAVFVVELGVPAQIEHDGRDASCRHAIAQTATGSAIGCARLLPDGHIGRIAVVRDWRGRGVGAAMLDRLVELARSLGHSRVSLNAQVNACGFYARQGFIRAGEPWLEAGIEHIAMERRLDEK